MPEQAQQLLKEHGLRKTLGRQQVLIFFRERDTAVSHGDLSKTFPSMDRAALYRILQDFEEKGIIHKVPDDEVSVKYAYCGHSCTASAHQDQHLHFKCDDCHQTYCLPEQETPQVHLPNGFVAHSMEVLVHGLCKACAWCIARSNLYKRLKAVNPGIHWAPGFSF